jgi:predicted membrane channel-forming protein YqfA (hemolysin III family)
MQLLKRIVRKIPVFTTTAAICFVIAAWGTPNLLVTLPLLAVCLIIIVVSWFYGLRIAGQIKQKGRSRNPQIAFMLILIFAVLLVLQLCITAILSNKPALDVFSSAEWVDLALWFWLSSGVLFYEPIGAYFYEATWRRREARLSVG